MCQSEVVVFGSHVGQICPFLKQTVDAWASKWKDAICLLLQVLVQNCLWELLFKICIWSLFHGLSTKLKLEMESFTCHVLGTCCWFDEPLPNVSWQPNAYFNWVILVCKRASAPSVNQCLTSFQWSVEICSNWDSRSLSCCWVNCVSAIAPWFHPMSSTNCSIRL